MSAMTVLFYRINFSFDIHIFCTYFFIMVWVPYLDTIHSNLDVRKVVPSMQLLALVAIGGRLEFMSKLNVDSHPSIVRHTSIGATIGGVTREIPKILELMENGMNICRINVSHRNHEYHAQSIRNIREAEEMYRNMIGQPFSCAIAIDTKGPEIRTGFKEPGLKELELKAGYFVRLTSDSAYMNKCTNQVIFVNHPELHILCSPGVKILIDEGKAMLQCLSIEGACVTCKILTDCVLADCRIVSLPNKYINLPKISVKDKEDLKFAIKQKADLVLASFTHNAEAVKNIRKYLKKKGNWIKIVAKIEDSVGLEHIDEIIEVSDGILIGKGDLGLESSIEKFFINQKLIASHCNKYGKPVICTRELWESMKKEPRPTRADVVDVGNSIQDGVDCFMFTRENVDGRYPAKSLHILSLICREAEATLWQTRIFQEFRDKADIPTNSLETIAIVAVQASLKGNASAIIVLTECGTSAQIISRYRPRCPILAVTRNEVTGRQSHLYCGIIPLYYDEPELENLEKEMDTKVQYAIDNGRKFGFIDRNDYIVVVFEWGTSTGLANSFRTLYVKEKIETVNDIIYVH